MSYTPSKSLILGAMLTASGAPDDEGAWLDPSEPTNASISPQWYKGIAQYCEKSGISFMFVADAVFADPEGCPHYLSRFEPLSLLSYLSAVTDHIGLVGTFSSSYNEPYNIARKLMSFDHLSQGRAGCNLVTSLGDKAARNFGLDSHLDHKTRYARAKEFLDVVRGLWNTYPEGTFVRDRSTGQYLDRSKVQTLNHHGEYFNVAGPLNIERSPQGEPVIFQAGQSPQGRSLAATSADVVFGMQTNIPAALAYRASLNDPGMGRPEGMKPPILLLKLMLHITDDDVAPQQAFDEYAHKHDIFNEIRRRVARAIEMDLEHIDLDALSITPEMTVKAHSNEGTWLSELLDHCAGHGYSMKETLRRIISDKALVFAGSVRHIASQMNEWLKCGAADGFIIQISSHKGAQDLGERLIPELRSRGLYAPDYPEPSTLRNILGLSHDSTQASLGNTLQTAKYHSR